MKVIFGIDTGRSYVPAIQLFARFRFANVEATRAHFYRPTPPFVAMDMPESATFMADFAREAENLGLVALDHAKDEACQRDIRSKSLMRTGGATEGLCHLAEEIHADLVAVRAEPGSMWATSFLGSVSRGLAIGCKSSILIAKDPVKEGAPLKVVLATDHSEESRRWIKKFLSWKPQGISEILVVTAYQLGAGEAQILSRHLPSLKSSANEWLEEHLERKNRGVCDQIRQAGYKVTSRVGYGTANDVIRAAMQDTQSDILVLGAQGHGFVQRLLVGSTALHQVVAEPYPVLVVRG